MIYRRRLFVTRGIICLCLALCSITLTFLSSKWINLHPLQVTKSIKGQTFTTYDQAPTLHSQKYINSGQTSTTDGKIKALNSTSSVTSDTATLNMSQLSAKASAPPMKQLKPRRKDDPVFKWDHTIPLDPGNLTSLPKPFITAFKNPCWIEDDKYLYCLPYFYLAGMPKCGTSDLWYKLGHHRQIVGVSRKELHWWTRVRINKYYTSSFLTPHAASYYATWGRILLGGAKTLQTEASGLITGDGSASTFWDHRYWRKFYPPDQQGPPFSIPALIYKIQPQAKIIVLFRDPVDRLYSDYFYTFRGNKSAQGFHEMVSRTVQEFIQCIQDHSQRWCTHMPEDTNLLTRSRIGLYYQYLHDWLEVFPRDQLMIIRTEEWSENCTNILQDVHKFLEIAPVGEIKRQQVCEQPHKNQRSSENAERGFMLPQTRQLLDTFYAPFNKQLADLIGDQRFTWSNG